VRVYRGRLEGFRGSWGSGIAHLIISGKAIPCDNGPTVRALQACYGGVIGRGHSVSEGPSWVGREVVWAYDDMGLVLGGFVPLEDWYDMDRPDIPDGPDGARVELVDGEYIVVEDGDDD